MWKNLGKRRVQIIRAHVTWGLELKGILEGKVRKKRGRGRPRLQYSLQLIKKWAF